MKRKIFISLNIPEKARKRLVLKTEKWHSLPVKWTKAQNLHLTLEFLGFVDENSLIEICKKVSQAAVKNNIFDIEFDAIELFPSATEPRAVALVGEPNEELKNLINDIEKELKLSTTPKKSFRPHITLGRIRKNKWQELETQPEISEKFSLNIEAEVVDIMASDFDCEEGEYAIIESCPLQ